MDQHKKSNQFYMGFDKELNELSVQGIAKLETYLETGPMSRFSTS